MNKPLPFPWQSEEPQEKLAQYDNALNRVQEADRAGQFMVAKAWRTRASEIAAEMVTDLRAENERLREALGAVAFEYRGRSGETTICRYCKQSAHSPLGPAAGSAIKHKPDCMVAELLALGGE